MPTGIIINVLSVAIGGLVGTLAGHKLSLDFKENLNMIFGVCAMTMGISSIVLMENMPAVIFAVVVGTAIGLAIHFGDLIAKSILDIFTAIIFACLLGPVVSFIALPQFVIFMLLYALAGVIYPLTTPAMIGDFKACGGILLLATGFRMIKVKMFPTADMIPAMVLVMPISWFWVNVIVPIL